MRIISNASCFGMVAGGSISPLLGALTGIRYKLQGKPNFLDKQLKITKKVLDRFFV